MKNADEDEATPHRPTFLNNSLPSSAKRNESEDEATLHRLLIAFLL
jgi:hypothetical protein